MTLDEKYLNTIDQLFHLVDQGVEFTYPLGRRITTVTCLQVGGKKRRIMTK